MQIQRGWADQVRCDGQATTDRSTTSAAPLATHTTSNCRRPIWCMSVLPSVCSPGLVGWPPCCAAPPRTMPRAITARIRPHGVAVLRYNERYRMLTLRDSPLALLCLIRTAAPARTEGRDGRECI